MDENQILELLCVEIKRLIDSYYDTRHKFTQLVQQYNNPEYLTNSMMRTYCTYAIMVYTSALKQAETMLAEMTKS
jgi:hypothetical protein